MGNQNFRFVTVNDPDKFKDKNEMRQNRKHVMFEFIAASRRRISFDNVSRAETQSRAESLLLNMTGGPVLPRAPLADDASRHTSVLSTRSFSHAQAITSTNRSANSDSTAKVATEPQNDDVTNPPASKGRKIGPEEQRQDQLIRKPNLTRSRYLNTPADLVPFPIQNLGEKLNAFNTWPLLSDSTLNTEKLKWSCSQYFGSEGITFYWVPALLQARHAFLSTICISAAHDDIMKRAVRSPDERSPHESTDRTKARVEVISLINEALKNPKMQTSDSTLVAVLQLLSGEIMGRDEKTLQLHQRGLHNMVRQRGGLEKLGVHGQLALVITINMYMISALRETVPHRDFVEWASRQHTTSPTESRQTPESPIYCGLAGFYTVKRSLSPSSPSYQLLDTVRLLTNSFVRESATFVGSSTFPASGASPDEVSSVVALHDKITTTRPAYTHRDDFTNSRERYLFESLRLVSRVYACALTFRLPFSKAAAVCAANAESGVSSTPVQLRNALLQTDLSNCWGPMAGVLFWLALVGGASVNPAYAANNPPKSMQHKNSSGQETMAGRREEEAEARQWFAAIAVRCSIVLGFDHGEVILETLKRFVGIQQALAQADADRTHANDPIIIRDVQQQQRHDSVTALHIPTDPINTFDVQDDLQEHFHGLVEPPYPVLEQSRFQDFAREFFDA